MTLILALACKDGIVFASDSLATVPVARDISTSKELAVNYTITKIMTLGNDKLWAASGNSSIIQQFEQYLESLQQSNPHFKFSDKGAMNDLKDEFAVILGDANRRYMRVYGTPGVSIPTTQLPHAQVLIVGCESLVKGERPHSRILHLDYDGQAMFFEKEYGYNAIGYDIFAIPLLREFKMAKYDTQLSSFFAYKVLTEAIFTSREIGEPVDIWTIDKKGRHKLTPDEQKNLEKTYTWWVDAAEEYFRTQVRKKLNSFSASQPPS